MRRRLALVSIATVATMGIMAQPALADVGLPYKFTIKYISGGDNGVDSPDFSSNSSGKICVDPNLKRTQDAYADGANDGRFLIQLWEDKNNAGDSRIGTFNFTLSSQGKQCYTSVPKNKKVYIRVKKTVFILDELLGGDGQVTYN